MATEFIGSIVTVTLNQPRGARVRGLVVGIAEGQRLDLKDVTWLARGNHVVALSIGTVNIKDLEIEPDTKPAIQSQTSSQRSPDPAILSFDRVVVKSSSKSHIRSLDDATPELTSSSPVKPAMQIETKPSDGTGATATLTGPFTDLALDDPTVIGMVLDQEQNTPAKGLTRKRTRNRRSVRKSHNDEPQAPSDHATRNVHTPTRAAGWGEPPFLQEASVGKKPHPLDAPIHRAEERLARARRGRRNDIKEDQNGWATEEATDIQDLGDFDFEGNLSKFDKRGVFEQIRQDDTTADEARLVSFNRVPVRPGTNGGKNLHYTENVLNSPQANGHGAWNGESGSESEKSDDKFSSGRVSRRNLSRASLRKPPSRKSSTMVHNDQTSSSGFPLRYSSQEHPSPRILRKASTSRHGMSEIPQSSKALFQLATSGAECPCVTPLQMLELEQLATFELGLSDDTMMENSARGIAQLAIKVATGKRIVILAGNTKTGARAIAAGRQLQNHGVRVLLFVLGMEREEDLLEVIRRQLSIYRNCGGQLLGFEKLVSMGTDGRKAPVDLVVDALLGMHLSFDDLGTGDQNAFFEIASWVNSTPTGVLAVDVPSGSDATTGSSSHSSSSANYAIVPSYVIALGAPKTGLLSTFVETEKEKGKLWKLFVADIGICNSVWKKFGTRRRYGVEFGVEWVEEVRFVGAGGGGGGM
ncbi:MAG: hypothetical protein Q9186_003523 [Xanthomendoza sp. 1 TL-2023]